jgi:hypothetical protein
MSSPISKNYLMKIESHASLDETLRAMLVESHENLGLKSNYFLKMENPKLDVSTSWHMTITTALERANILTGKFKIYLKQRILTLQECEAIRSCEEGELDPYKGCSITRAKEIRELREREQYEEQKEEIARRLEHDEEDEYEELLEQAEHDEELQELLECWLEKMDRPGRKLARGTDESAIDILKREKTMKEIQRMSAKEFQIRLLNGTLPDFPREKPPTGLYRDTCHTRRFLTEEDFLRPECINNYAEHHKDKLRYMSAECFKYLCYQEFDGEF